MLREKPRPGGHSIIRKVRDHYGGSLGALKEFEPQSDNEERRARLAREVFALKTLHGLGVPKVLDDNTQDYEDRRIPLYAVMEWIEGPTLEGKVSGNPMGIDESISVVLGLASTLQKCHEAKIVHRNTLDNLTHLRSSFTAFGILSDSAS